MSESPDRAPRAAILLSSGFGLGRMPIASGTWGSLGGVAVYVFLAWTLPRVGSAWALGSFLFLAAYLVVNVLVALVGVWAAGATARYLNKSDPGLVVIDEISGQLISYLPLVTLDWKYLLAGFLIFRALDIWKPFPARQVEAWPGGWGIMADDWVVGIYTALLLGAARWVWG